MSKKHFIELANVIRENPNAFPEAALEKLADFCRSQNYNFNRARWMAYIRGECGPNGGKVE